MSTRMYRIAIEFPDKIIYCIIAKFNYISNSNWLYKELIQNIKNLIDTIFNIYKKFINSIISNDILYLSNDCLRYFIIPPVIWYFIFYKKFKSASISEIYQDDKYGIVILYSAIICLQSFHLIWLNYIQDVMAIRKGDIQNQPGEQSEKVLGNWRFNMVYLANIVATEAVRIISFNLIFNNHTSDNKLLNAIHIYHVVQYGFFSLMRHMLCAPIIKYISPELKHGELFLKRRCIWTALYGSIFLGLEFFIYKKHNWSNSIIFKLTRVVSEVLAIAHSI